jgi:hypothetical protein
VDSNCRSPVRWATVSLQGRLRQHSGYPRRFCTSTPLSRQGGDLGVGETTGAQHRLGRLVKARRRNSFIPPKRAPVIAELRRVTDGREQNSVQFQGRNRPAKPAPSPSPELFVKSWQLARVLQGDSSSPTRRCRLARDRSQKLKDAGGFRSGRLPPITPRHCMLKSLPGAHFRAQLQQYPQFVGTAPALHDLAVLRIAAP